MIHAQSDQHDAQTLREHLRVPSNGLKDSPLGRRRVRSEHLTLPSSRDLLVTGPGLVYVFLRLLALLAFPGTLFATRAVVGEAFLHVDENDLTLGAAGLVILILFIASFWWLILLALAITFLTWAAHSGGIGPAGIVAGIFLACVLFAQYRKFMSSLHEEQKRRLGRILWRSLSWSWGFILAEAVVSLWSRNELFVIQIGAALGALLLAIARVPGAIAWDAQLQMQGAERRNRRE